MALLRLIYYELRRVAYTYQEYNYIHDLVRINGAVYSNVHL